MIEQLSKLLQHRVEQYVKQVKSEDIKLLRKKDLLARRHAEIVKAKARAKVKKQHQVKENTQIDYDVHFIYLIKQKDRYFLEEEIEQRTAEFYKGKLITDEEVFFIESMNGPVLKLDSHQDLSRIAYRYDRLKAVQYAERWWNDYNPQYKKFQDDCTNYISQCLHAGGAPMRGYPDRTKGWWMRGEQWSYSWTVANSLRWYLATSKVGLRAKEVNDPRELQLGDVICYDFEGDGRFNHNTIVVSKDLIGMPLVNAHSYNSRMRYWSYEDSSAYTENIQYKFYTIVDDS